MKKQFSLLTVSLTLATWAGMAEAAKTPPATCKPIGDVFRKDPKFSTLYTALRASGLVNSLGTQRSYTFFAPSNAAFSKIPAQQLAALLSDQQALRNLLLYHVVPEQASVEQIRGSASGVTLQGSPIAISHQNGAVTVNDAKIVKSDISVCNGMVHTVDSVLLPATLTGQSGQTNVKTQRTGVQTTRLTTPSRVVQTVASVPSFPAHHAQSNTHSVNSNSSATIAAQPRVASPKRKRTIQQASQGTSARHQYRYQQTKTKNQKSPNPKGPKPTPIAKNVVDDKILDISTIPALPVRELAKNQLPTYVTSVSSQRARRNITRTLSANRTSKAARRTQMVQVRGENIAQLLSQDPRFSILRELLSKTDLLDTLGMNMGEYTLFAPTNKAFSRMDKHTLSRLAADPVKLKAALMYHIVSGRPSFELHRSVPVTTVESSSLMVARDSGRIRLGKVSSEGLAINTKNGNVYAIDSVLIPPTVK